MLVWKEFSVVLILVWVFMQHYTTVNIILPFPFSLIIALLQGDPLSRNDDDQVEFWRQQTYCGIKILPCKRLKCNGVKLIYFNVWGFASDNEHTLNVYKHFVIMFGIGQYN
jgi:hypothetical protein